MKHDLGTSSALARRKTLLSASLAILLTLLTLASFVTLPSSRSTYRPTLSPRIQDIWTTSQERCKEAYAPAGPPSSFHSRTVSDRYEPHTPDLLIRNATIWTGEDSGSQILRSHDILLSKGLIRRISPSGIHSAVNVEVLEAEGRWVTPGLVDMHVHISAMSTLGLQGADDTNSIGNNVNPWLRIVDGMNQHDQSFKLSIGGGVTTGLVLPGSANSMGGQAYPIKYRQVSSHIPGDRIVDPPKALTRLGKEYGQETGMRRNDSTSSFRHMKMACGENARRIYSITRMDESWDFRRTFQEARLLKEKQDTFCSSYKTPLSEAEATFPFDLGLEALIDLLRNKVKLNTHCYTQIDFETFIRHSKEFEFPISAFHHAHEAYLLPSLLKQTYGNDTPTIAIFSTNANYKLEAYFGSPFAGAILASHNVTPVYKSDHPVTDSRRIINQAAQGHHFGLDERSAMRSVITAPAEAIGLDHRIGYVRTGWDADLVIWNSHPLVMGATPVQVLIDGIKQIEKGFTPKSEKQLSPNSANFTKEIKEVTSHYDEIINMEKLAFPTIGKEVEECTILTNLSTIYYKQNGKIRDRIAPERIVLQKGETCQDCPCSGPTLSLPGGILTPGLTSYGSDLGLTDIVSEPEASDGYTRDSLSQLSSLPLVRAVDGIQYNGHDILRARASGVTSAIVFPQSNTFFSGVSVRFDTGAATTLSQNAIRKQEVAFHLTLTHHLSMSKQVALLRNLLQTDWKDVAKGEKTLVVTALRADHIATLLRLKDDLPNLNLILSGITEGHLIAQEIAKRNVPVLLIPQTWPRTFDEIRGLPGPPLSRHTLLSSLLDANVTVALKIEEAWMASNLIWDSTRACLEANLTNLQALELLTTSFDSIFGEDKVVDTVVWDSSPFEYGAKVVAISGPRGTGFV